MNVFKLLREAFDMSQSEVATASGMSQSSVSGIESTSSNPTLASVIRYVGVFSNKWSLVLNVEEVSYVIAKGDHE